MFSRLAAAVTLLAVVATALGQALTINTPPSVVTCQPVQLTWTGGQGPYFLLTVVDVVGLVLQSILPGNQPGAAALVDFGRQDGNSLTWNTNLAAGTSIFLQVRDSQGAVGQSGTINIQSSSDTSCVGQTPSTSAGPAQTGSPSSPPAGGSSTTPAGTTAAPGSSTTGASSTGTGTRSTTASTTSGAANNNGAVKVGSAGALALAGVAAVAALL